MNAINRCADKRKWLTSGLSIRPLSTINHPINAWKQPNISNKLKLFSNMDFKEMGNNGYIYAKKHYDINKIIGKFLDVFLW